MTGPILFIDSDMSLGTPGAEIDDGAALLMLLNSPAAQIAGISAVFGNVPVVDAWTNLIHFLHAVGRQEIPIAAGAERPLRVDMEWFKPWQAGYGATPPLRFKKPVIEGAQLLIECARQHAGQLMILSLGPMTTIAQAIQSAPQIVGQVKALFAMGGSFGGQSQEAEFNMRCDPHAADRVIHAGWPVTLFGLELTRQVHFSREDFHPMAGNNPAQALLKKQAPGWIERVEGMGWESGGCSLHDAVAAACLLDNSLFRAQPAEVSINLNDDNRLGKTIVRQSPDNRSRISVAVELDVRRCREMIWSLCCTDDFLRKN